MKKIARPSLWHRYPRKWWVISAGALLALLVVGFVGGSLYAWNDYRGQYEAWYGGLRSEARAALDMKANTAAEKTKKLEALNRLQKTAEQGSVRCARYGWIQGQQFVGEVKKSVDGCHAKQQVADVFATDLRAATAHLQGEIAIGKALTGAAASKETDETSWGQIADKWAKARGDVKKLQLASTVKETQKMGEEKAAALEAAWRALIVANAVKDRQKYEVALDQIATAYGGLSDISEAARASLRPLADKLETSYERILL